MLHRHEDGELEDHRRPLGKRPDIRTEMFFLATTSVDAAVRLQDRFLETYEIDPGVVEGCAPTMPRFCESSLTG
ncbi:MAG: hypothetical protein R3D02_10820 [Hyphomicrobiales bacterium]